MADAEKLILTRKHPVFAHRGESIRMNQLVLDGGRPYIYARLERFPYEPSASWDGNSSTGAKGRKDRAFLTNYAARVARKFNQYVFSEAVKRPGINPDFEADATKTRQTIQQFMESVSSQLTATRWCWIGIDRAAASVDEQTGTVRPQSVAQKEARGDRVFWTLWRADEVVDWCFDSAGRLLWLITTETLLESKNPFAEPVSQKIRTLWVQGGTGRRYFIDPNDGEKVSRIADFTYSSHEIPFVPCGTISATPWWFDEAEMIQASLLNLENVHNENLFQMVYPQAVYPADIARDASGNSDGTSNVGDMIRRVGLHYPIFESMETKGVSRYITPDPTGLKSIPDEIQRRKREFFDIVGMALATPESRQVASAEAKQWDHLDVEAVLAERASLLEAIERKAVALSVLLDSTFEVYEPAYSREFDVSDVASDFQALIQVANVVTTPEAVREVQFAGVHLLSKITPIPSDRLQRITDEIAAMNPTEAGVVAPPPVPTSGNGAA